LVGGALARAQKKAEAEGWTLVWVDETGCYLLPAVVRTYAPRGQTPILRAPWSREHLSVIGALTATGRFVCHVREASLRGPDVVRFLRHLLRRVPGKLLGIWDGATIHRNQTVRAFLAAGAAARLHLEPLPGYAPDLNPAEGIWRYLKRVELRNLCCPTLWDLKAEWRLALARLRHKPQILRSCIRHAGYSL
jgi:transposase